MKVTINKRLNGIEFHPAYTTPDGQDVPMKAIATYNFEVPELGFQTKKHLDLIPSMNDAQKAQVEGTLTQVQQLIDNLPV